MEAVLDRQVDGIVFAAMRAREIAIPRVPTATPIVILNATTHESHPSVRPDDYEGGRHGIAIPYEEMGEVAVLMLLDRQSDDHIIEMPLIERASLGPRSR